MDRSNPPVPSDEESLTTQELNPPCPRCRDSLLRPVLVFSADVVVGGDLCFNCNFFASYPNDGAWRSRWKLSACKEWEKGNLTETDLNQLLKLKDRLTTKITRQH